MFFFNKSSVTRRGGVSVQSVRVRGANVTNHVATNDVTGRRVSINQHDDNTFNVRDDRNVEIYDGELSDSLIETIFNALFNWGR